MNCQDKEMYCRLLLTLRAQLRSEVSILLDAALDVDVTAPPPDPCDTCDVCPATRRTSVARTWRDFIERLIDRKGAMLCQVENALAQLAEDAYGICQECQSPIPDDWLLTIPYTMLCATCHSRQTVT
jgi:hypothetical protein